MHVAAQFDPTKTSTNLLIHIFLLIDYADMGSYYKRGKPEVRKALQ